MTQTQTLFDVLCAHDPPGIIPGEVVAGIMRVQVWVRKINARYPEEAMRKAAGFLIAERGVSNVRALRVCRRHSPQEEGDHDAIFIGR